MALQIALLFKMLEVIWISYGINLISNGVFGWFCSLGKMSFPYYTNLLVGQESLIES